MWVIERLTGGVRFDRQRAAVHPGPWRPILERFRGREVVCITRGLASHGSWACTGAAVCRADVDHSTLRGGSVEPQTPLKHHVAAAGESVPLRPLTPATGQALLF